MKRITLSIVLLLLFTAFAIAETSLDGVDEQLEILYDVSVEHASELESRN